MSVRRRATLADVAALAGVSVTTASYVVNDRAEQMRISNDAAERVRKAAKKLSYRPNRSARTLRTSRTSTIGVISDRVASGPYASQMLSGAMAAARASNHLVVIGETDGDPTLEEQLIEEMVDRQVDGFLYATLTASEVRVPRSLADSAVVLLNCVDFDGVRPSVLPDELEGGRLAARTLVEAGLGAAVHVIGEDPTPHAIAGSLRVAGVRAELQQGGHTLAGLVPCPWDVHAAYDAVTAWLATGVRPTALVCLNDRTAMGTYQALADAGLTVPGDVSVVSFDGSSLATWLRPALTSVEIPFAELGARAADLLLDPGRDAAGVVRVAMPLLGGASVRIPTTGETRVGDPTRSRGQRV